MRISDWSSDVCSSDLKNAVQHVAHRCPPAFLQRLLRSQRRPDAGQGGRFASHLPQVKMGKADAVPALAPIERQPFRSEEHTPELQLQMRLSFAVFCLKKKQIPTRLNYNVTIKSLCPHYD